MLLAGISRGFTGRDPLFQRYIRYIELCFITASDLLEYRSYHREYHIREGIPEETPLVSYFRLSISPPHSWILEYSRSREITRSIRYSAVTRISRRTLLRWSRQSR